MTFIVAKVDVQEHDISLFVPKIVKMMIIYDYSSLFRSASDNSKQ